MRTQSKIEILRQQQQAIETHVKETTAPLKEDIRQLSKQQDEKRQQYENENKFFDLLIDETMRNLQNECYQYLIYLHELIESAIKKNHPDIYLLHTLSYLGTGETHVSKTGIKYDLITDPNLKPIHPKGQLNIHHLAEDAANNKELSLPRPIVLALKKYDVMLKLTTNITKPAASTRDKISKIDQFDLNLNKNIQILEKHRDNAFIHFLKSVASTLSNWFSAKKTYSVKGAAFTSNINRLLTNKPLTAAPGNTAEHKQKKHLGK